MKNIFIFTFALFLAACGGSDGSSSGGGNTGFSNKPEDWSKAPALERFTAETDLAGKEASLYDYGCKKPGKSEALVRFDTNRLKVGAKYWNTSVIESNVPGNPSARLLLTSEDTVTAVENRRLTMTSLIIEGKDFGYAPKTKTSTVCVLNSKDEEECKTTPEAKVQQPPLCFAVAIPFASPNNKDSPLQGGTFTLRNGQKLEAYLKTSKEVGTVFCDGNQLGKGEMITKEIFAKDLPDTGARYCGGTSVYSETKVFFEGKVITLFSGEINAVQ